MKSKIIDCRKLSVFLVKLDDDYIFGQNEGEKGGTKESTYLCFQRP